MHQREYGKVSPAYFATHALTAPQSEKADNGFSLVATLVGADDNTTSVFADRILLEALGATSTTDPVDGPTL